MIKFVVPDMTCGHCVGSVDKAIRAVDSDAIAKIDLSTRTVTIETSVAPEVIGASITAAGYTPSLSK